MKKAIKLLLGRGKETTIAVINYGLYNNWYSIRLGHIPPPGKGKGLIMAICQLN